MEKSRNNKVVLAMSGGIDSAVSAYLLQEQGYEVTGLNFKFWKYENNSKEELRIEKLLNDISVKLSIKIHQLNYSDLFKQKVLTEFFNDIQHGFTPNPCVFCNPMVKFSLLLKFAQENNFSKISTGHYARVVYKSESDKYSLMKGLDKNKDQSYMLCFLNQEILSRTLFPLGYTTKRMIFDLGNELQFKSAAEEESQDLCFVRPENYHAFLSKEMKNQGKGKIVDSSGRILGEHDGLFHYTIGQRKGIKVFGSEPFYVIGKNIKKNELIIGHKEENTGNAFSVIEPNWISEKPVFPLETSVKIRYRSQPIACVVKESVDGMLRIELDCAAKGITPGQYAVFYENEIVLGGGKIIR